MVHFQRPTRLSGVILLKNNLLDPLLYISSSVSYLVCLAVGYHLSLAGFLVLLLGLIWLFQRHLESYRTFKLTRRWVRALENNDKSIESFLAANFADDRGYLASQAAQASAGPRADTYLWINKIISYFWPYLSHVVHHEINEFLALAGSLARDDGGLKKFVYALVRQLDANILAVEHCELGARAPFLNSLVVFDEGAQDKSIVCDFDLAYEGNMNMSFICRYCCCCSSRIGFKDVFVHLRGRLALGPIEESKPQVDGVSFSLLELPAFGYKGIALVELAELKLAKRAINRSIREHLLYPKQLRLTLEALQEKLLERERAALEAQQRGSVASAATETRSPALQSDSLAPRRAPLFSRLLARLACSTCICSNVCLRCCCQRERVKSAYGEKES